MPERIRLSRQAGWRLPPGVISVARPARFGNPFRIVPTPGGPFEIRYGPGRGDWVSERDDKQAAAAAAVDMFAAALREGRLPYDVEHVRVSLAGAALACWCPLVDAAGDRYPCHADVLLDVAAGVGVS